MAVEHVVTEVGVLVTVKVPKVAAGGDPAERAVAAVKAAEKIIESEGAEVVSVKEAPSPETED